jgi:hypothetical protein
MRKFLYGVVFEKRTGRAALIENADGTISFPGGEVYWEDVCSCVDERWIREFLSFKAELQTGIPRGVIWKMIQPLPATYNVYEYDFQKEYSVIIVGEVDSKYLKDERIKLYSFNEFLKKVAEGKITRIQQIILLRIFASRDYHGNDEDRKGAGKILQGMHK